MLVLVLLVTFLDSIKIDRTYWAFLVLVSSLVAVVVVLVLMLVLVLVLMLVVVIF